VAIIGKMATLLAYTLQARVSMNGFNLNEEDLLTKYRRAKDLQIERLLSQYGTSLADVREMYPQLTEAISQRQLTTTFPTQPLFFTASEAAEMGLALQEGAMLKLTPMEGNGGFTSSIITPTKWEITEDNYYISPSGQKLSEADMQAWLSEPTGQVIPEGWEVPSWSLTIENLNEEGKAAYREYQATGGELDVAGWVDLRERQRLEKEEVFGAVFPQQDINEVIDYMNRDREGFLADIREIGPTEEMVRFLKMIPFDDGQGGTVHLSDIDIDELFAPTVVPEFEAEGWAKDYLWDPFIAGAVSFKQGIETFLFTNPPSLPSKEVPFPVATHTTAIPPEFQFEAAQQAYENALQNTIDGYLRRKADQQTFWTEHPELTPKAEYLESPFDNPSLFLDPGYIAYSVSSSLAYTLAVMGTIVAVSAVATPAVGIPVGLLVAGMPEAGNMIDELVDMGVPIDQAQNPARLYGLAVGGIETVSDLPFIGLIFKPIGQAVKPMWNTILKGTASRLARAIITGAVIPQIEGVEELVTQVVHNTILKNYDATQSIMEGVSHAYIQGVIASLPFGVIGGGASFQTFRGGLSQETGAQYDKLVGDFQKAGLTEEEAQVQAANEIAKTPEGEVELSKAIEAAQEEYYEEHPEVEKPSVEPTISTLPESILQDIEVAEEVAKGKPVTLEVTEDILTISRQQFEITGISGYKLNTEQQAIGSRRGGITTINPKFFELNSGERKALLTHELGHDVAAEMLKGEEWQVLLEPFRLDKGKSISVRSTFDNPFGFNNKPEEVLADAYAWYIEKGVTGWESDEYLNILRAVRDTGNKLGIKEFTPVIPEVPTAEAGMAEVTSFEENLSELYADITIPTWDLTEAALLNRIARIDKFVADIETATKGIKVKFKGDWYVKNVADNIAGIIKRIQKETNPSKKLILFNELKQELHSAVIDHLGMNEYYSSKLGVADFGRLLETASQGGFTPAIPETPTGMPEAGIQPSMLEEVPAKEIRPEARGKLVQSRLDDYLRLREYNSKVTEDRISEIKSLLEKKGRLPKDLGTKGNLRLELARLEALRELDGIEIVEELDTLIRQVSEELGIRSLPGQGRPARKGIELARHPIRPNAFPEYTSRQLEEMLKVYQEARQKMSPEIPAVSLVKAEDITTGIPALTNTQLTPRQVERTIELFKDAVAAPNAEMQRAAAIELRKHVFAQRAQSASESAQAMIVEGMNPEEAIKAAEQMFMTGKLPDVTTDYFNDLTQEMRNVLFAKVVNYWKGKPEGWTEIMAGYTALTNALAGKSIPRVKGIGTKYFPDGGSAWDRLARVFIGDEELLEALDRGESLTKIIEGIYLETGRGEVSLSQETVNWLKELSTISEEDRILLEKPLSEITENDVKRIAQAWFWERRNELNNLLKDGVISNEEYKLQLAIAKDRVFPHKPIAPAAYYPGAVFGQPRLGEEYVAPEALAEERTEEQLRLQKETMEAARGLAEARAKRAKEQFQPVVIDPIVNSAFEQAPMFTLSEKQTISRVLKGLGWNVVDINNMLRGGMASFDASFPRQGKYLMCGHPYIAYQMGIAFWKSFNTAEAEAIQQRIMQDPLMELYEDIRKEFGFDFLRIMGVKKGTAQWRAAEEYGYPTTERLLPRITQKVTAPFERIFVTPLNVGSWTLYKDKYKEVIRYAEKVASGQIKLKEGESVDIRKEMSIYQEQIGNLVQRASLGQYNKLGPILNTMFFAARSKLARFFFPLGLTGIYRRGGEWHFSRGLMKETWRDFMITNALISGVVLFGDFMDWWEAEKDPRNAEFMSIRIGNMRIDPWAGYRQFLVLYTRLATGTGVSSVTGAEYEADPIKTLTNFLRGSLAPVPSILWDFWTGRNFLGVAVDLTNAEQWIQRIAPFAVQDIWEAFDEGTREGMIAIIPAIFGEGVQTYTGDWREDWAKLGLPKYPENTGYGITEPVYDLADFWADTASQFRGVDPSELTESKGFPEYIRSIAQVLQIIEQIESLPNKRLTSLNADPEEGTTFKQYYEMWQERQKIVASGDEESLKAFDSDERTRNAYLGNMTQAQYSLLIKYHYLNEDGKAKFLINHPELYANPREDWLRSHPEENALLALWDKANIYSLDALDKIDSLAKSLGIPENAMITRELDEVAKLKLKNKELFDLLDAYGGLDNEIKGPEGLTARDTAIQELYEENPEFRNDIRRIEALSEGTEDNPTPEDIVEAWVDRGIIVDEYGASSSEAKLWLIDNGEAHQWALESGLLTDTGEDWNEPVLRLQVEYRDDFDLYDAYGDRKSEHYISNDAQRAEARRGLLFDNRGRITDFGKAYYTKQAYGADVAEKYIGLYVEYYQMPVAGYDQERFLMEHEDYYEDVWKGVLGNQPKDFTKVPTISEEKLLNRYDDLPTGTPRLQARCQNADLDAALVRLRGLVPAYGTDRCD